MTVKCEVCGEEYNKRPSEIKRVKNNFCKKCREEYNQQNHYFTAICENCGEEFKRVNCEKNNTKRKYCDKCYLLFKVKKEPIKLICEKCGEEFKRDASIHKRLKHCFCDKCKPSIEYGSIELICENCQKSYKIFKSQDGSYRHNYCKECRKVLESKTGQIEIECDYCHKKYKKLISMLQDKNYCSKKCSGMAKRTGDYIICQNEKCGKIIYKKNHMIQSGSNLFCSFKCASEYHGRNRETLICTQCGKEYTRMASEVKWSKIRGHQNSFCSKECQFKYQGINGANLKYKEYTYILNKQELLKARRGKEIREWKKFVRERDEDTCQLCKTKITNATPEVHHIKNFKDHPNLRTENSNGITLCSSCHKLTYRKEEQYEELFQNIVKENTKKYNQKLQNLNNENKTEGSNNIIIPQIPIEEEINENKTN